MPSTLLYLSFCKIVFQIVSLALVLFAVFRSTPWYEALVWCAAHKFCRHTTQFSKFVWLLKNPHQHTSFVLLVWGTKQFYLDWKFSVRCEWRKCVLLPYHIRSLLSPISHSHIYTSAYDTRHHHKFAVRFRHGMTKALQARICMCVCCVGGRWRVSGHEYIWHGMLSHFCWQQKQQNDYSTV